MGSWPLFPKAVKFPPPTVSVSKATLYISSSPFEYSKKEEKETIEIEPDSIPGGTSVVVVDDVLSKGNTLVAVLQLLEKAGVSAENISVMVVAELPIHRARERWQKCGYGAVKVQNLLVFDGE